MSEAFDICDGIGGILAKLRGRRIGLVANPTAVDRDLRHLLDTLRGDGLDVVALFGPEHGFYGDLDSAVASTVDARTGLPVHSLYGDTRKPTSEMLEGIDTLVFSMQDVGVRFYTYVSTMYHCLEAAAENGLGFVVVDRPNPITGTRIEGNIPDVGRLSFVGVRPMPVRHGMTIGELALMFRVTCGLDVDLAVARMPSWRRGMWFDETGWPWILPSPAMATPLTATVYPGTCFLEGTNVAEGRGTSRPFDWIGAPWIDAFTLADAMNARGLDGVHFRPTYFEPVLREYAGERCAGCQIHVTDRDAFGPVRSVMHLLSQLVASCPDRLVFDVARFDRLAGTGTTRERLLRGDDPDAIVDSWREPRRAWETERDAYLIYS